MKATTLIADGSTLRRVSNLRRTLLMIVTALIVLTSSRLASAQESLFDRRSRRPWWSKLRDPATQSQGDAVIHMDLPVTGELPVDVDGSLIIDASHSLSGGQTTHRGTVRNLFELALSTHTEPLFGFQGGTLQVMIQNHAGANGSSLVGDVQGFSNIDADGRTQISEFWYEQLFADDQWRLRVGKMDANSQFAFVEHGLVFLNSSMGVSPTIFAMPTYPDPSFGISLFREPDEGFYAGLGLFDGAGARGIPTGSRGIELLVRGTDLFAIGEAGWKWNVGGEFVADQPQYPGRLGLGGWFHDGTFAQFDGRTQSGTGGFYLVFDQILLREFGDESGSQGLGLFAQYGYANPEVIAITHHFGTGLTWTGLFPGRNADRLGFGISVAGLSRQGSPAPQDRFEVASEIFYEVNVNSHASVLFDIQHIANPGGQRMVRDAVVGSVRFVLTGSLSDLFADETPY